MNLDDELERRLTERAHDTVAEPDLAAVESASGQCRTRRRRTAAVATVAVSGLAVVGVLAVSSRRPEPEPPASEAATTVVVPQTSGATPAVTEPSSADAGGSGSMAAPAPTVSGEQPGTDPAEPYLPRTIEVYRRTVDGREIVVRQSADSWAEFFDLQWRAPTGSAEACMGDSALLVGDPLRRGPLESMWEPIEAFDHADAEVILFQSMFGDYLVARSGGAATEVVLVNGSGDKVDRAQFVNGFAVLVTTDLWSDHPSPESDVLEPEPGQPSVRLVADGVEGEPRPFSEVVSGRTDDPECVPWPLPSRPLPPPGEQPVDPIAAEVEIRARHALAVDRSVTLSEEPGIVDDTTGIEEAVAQADAGQYADVAAAAVHTIDEVVFTAPGEAWFEYSITTSIGEMPGRFGIARFNGSVWQITRDTICQDLAEAGGICEPDFVPNVPPDPEGWADRMAEYERTSELYFEHQNCPPPPFDGGWCVTVDEPEQVTPSGDGG